jgi:ComF family protein
MNMPAVSRLREWSEAALAFVYPPVCQLCGQHRAGAPEGYVCEHCWEKVRFVQPPCCDRCGLPFAGEITAAFECANCRDMELHFTSARAAVVANDFMLEVIHRYKYNRERWFEPFLVELLLRQAVPALRAISLAGIVPVPLHPVKRREREFNQAEQLARPLAAALGIPVLTKLVKRVQPTRTQTQLDKRARAENVRRAFAPGSLKRLTGEQLLVFDDVLTTGATTSAVARVLRAQGAAEVMVWSLARGT